MTNKSPVSWQHCDQRCQTIAKKLKKEHPTTKPRKIFGIPRGGIYPALILRDWLARAGQVSHIVNRADEATVIVDDIIDSGDTYEHYRELYPDTPFFAMFDKTDGSGDDELGWLVFPWELANDEHGPNDAVTRMLQYIGENPDREGLVDTPARVVKSWGELYAGYKQNPEQHMKTFSDGACDEMVVLCDIEFYSNCEHHMQPFFGKAHIAYIPNEKVIGISKLARILEVFTRRLQIQERIGQQVTEALMDGLDARGAACVLEAKHFCMVCRGIGKQNSIMITSSLRGAFKDDTATRAEFMSLIRNR